MHLTDPDGNEVELYCELSRRKWMGERYFTMSFESSHDPDSRSSRIQQSIRQL